MCLKQVTILGAWSWSGWELWESYKIRAQGRGAASHWSRAAPREVLILWLLSHFGSLARRSAGSQRGPSGDMVQMLASACWSLKL